MGIDMPFFFNGDPNQFQWKSDQIGLTEKEKDLLEPFSYEGTIFNAYDETYDLNFEMTISSNSEYIRINKFPIIAYTFTDGGYEKIFQGINITPEFLLSETFNIQLQLKIY